MTNWKSKLIDAYRFATVPMRVWQRSSLIGAGKLPVFVLFYHRVSNVHPNPWTISTADFEQQIDWLQANYHLASLAECQEVINSGFNRKPVVSITFDDGYAENLEFAIPLLIERRIPVTYFVTYGNIANQVPFSHDLSLGQPLPVNSLESIRAMANAGIEIGSHTRNHVDIGKISEREQLADELIASSRDLSDAISRPVRYFAFPYGKRKNLTAEAFELLREEGFAGACTAIGGANSIGTDSFQINRYHGDPSIERLKNWLSFDPRLPLFDYFDYPRPETPSF